MDHSIAAKYAARPAARFVRPSTRFRERRLGLRPSGTFKAPGVRATVLHGPAVAPVTQLRAGWRAIKPAAVRRPHGGRPRPLVVMALVPFRSLRDGTSIGRRVGAVARLRSATATSAGGIVVRFDSEGPWLVVGSRRRERDSRTWTLPKGTPTAGETREQTALREVAEETGLEVRITGPLDSIEYWFVQSGTRFHKTVHYFLMEPIGGDLARHDHEFEEVRWIRFNEAPALLTFETERALVARAARILAGSSQADAGARPPATEPPTRGADMTDEVDERRSRETPLVEAHRALGARLIEFSWLADARPVQLDPRGASCRPRAGGPVRPVAHGRAATSTAPRPARPWPRALVTRPAGARGRARPVLDDLRARRRRHRRPDRLPPRRGAVPRRRQRRQRAASYRTRSPSDSTGFRAVLDDRSLATGLLAVQGPRAREVLSPLTDVDLGGLRYYAATEGTVAGIPALVARTGYTGEDGFEVFVETGRDRASCGTILLEAVRAADGVPVGLGARDTLRLEAGMPLYGNELDRDDDAVRRRARSGRQARQAGRLRGTRGARASRRARAPRSGSSGSSSRAVASPAMATRSAPASGGLGVVTSGTQSPTLGVPIAMAYVAPDDARAGYRCRRRDPRRPRPGPGRHRCRSIGGLSDAMVPSGLRYTKDHEWVRVDGDERHRRDHRIRGRPARRHRVRRAARRRPRRSRQRRRSASSSRSRP